MLLSTRRLLSFQRSLSGLASVRWCSKRACDTIRDACHLAPLHNPPNLHCIEAAQQLFPDAPHVSCVGYCCCAALRHSGGGSAGAWGGGQAPLPAHLPGSAQALCPSHQQPLHNQALPPTPVCRAHDRWLCLTPRSTRRTYHCIHQTILASNHPPMQVAVFDTTFHQTMPPEAYTYALPMGLAQEHRIRRYGGVPGCLAGWVGWGCLAGGMDGEPCCGCLLWSHAAAPAAARAAAGFHGISYSYLTREAARMLGKPQEAVNLILCHLGGCRLGVRGCM